MLALPPHQFHRRSAVSDTLVNRAAQIDALSGAAGLFAAGQAHPHRLCQPCRNSVCLCKIRRIGEMAEIGFGQRIGA